MVTGLGNAAPELWRISWPVARANLDLVQFWGLQNHVLEVNWGAAPNPNLPADCGQVWVSAAPIETHWGS